MILIWIFCLADFAQADINSCQKIIINAPENVQPEGVFKVSASFEKETQPSISKFNWTIILGGNVSKISDRGIIEINSKELKDSDSIIILAESLDGKCQDASMAKVFVVPACILPLTIDQYSKPNWNDERARLDNVAYQMEQFKDMALFVFFEFTSKMPAREKRSRLNKLLTYLTETRGLKKDKIVFLISESDLETVKFQPLPKDYDVTVFNDYLSIGGEDFDKLNNLFQSTTIKRKNK